ncbi:MAG: hypothetical protein QNJ40_07540 [Xanthomonadales bacterium]|nr:hypothetical protein [Xanthomonadales bacterium]
MSLLDQLEQQAKERKEKERRDQQALNQQQDRYRSLTAPAMKKLFEYLKKLAQHVKYLDSPQKITYHVPHYGDVTATIDPEFQIRLSSEKGVRSEVQVQANGFIEKSSVPEVTLNPQQADALDSFVREHSLHGDKKVMKTASGEMVGATYRIHGQIICLGTVRSHTDSKMLDFEFVNFRGLEVQRRRANPEQVNDDFCDKLGRFLVGQDLSFFSETLPESYKEGIKEQVKKQEEVKKMEMLEIEIERLEREEEKAASLRGRLSNRFGFLSKRLKGD